MSKYQLKKCRMWCKQTHTALSEVYVAKNANLESPAHVSEDHSNGMSSRTAQLRLKDLDGFHTLAEISTECAAEQRRKAHQLLPNYKPK